MVKEKPILFSTDMVRAILEDRKRQTRRVIKPQPNWFDVITDEEAKERALSGFDPYGFRLNTPTQAEAIKKAPYQPGDILWVWETFAQIRNIETGHVDTFYAANKKDCDTVNSTYLCDDDGFETDRHIPCKPSIHMPRVAARIFLRVTDVRVERIHSITVEDAVKEGVYTDTPGYWDNGWSPTFNDPDSGGEPNYINGFKMEWDARNAKRGYGWDSNPWVWVYTFERITKKEGEHGH